MDRLQLYLALLGLATAVCLGVLAIPDADISFSWRLEFTEAVSLAFLLLSIVIFLWSSRHRTVYGSGTSERGEYLKAKSDVSEQLHRRLNEILSTEQAQKDFENYPSVSSLLHSLPLIHLDEVASYRLKAKKALIYDGARLYNRDGNRELRVEQLASNAINTMTIPDKLNAL